jgi:hypothetical protein
VYAVFGLLTLALAGRILVCFGTHTTAPITPCKTSPIVRFILVICEAVHIADRNLYQATTMFRLAIYSKAQFVVDSVHGSIKLVFMTARIQ